MNASEFSSLLQESESINTAQTSALKNVLTDFPYFQSARALYLKGLKNQDSYNYNTELKITAAYTTDRSILFDYITSTAFNQNLISKTQQKLQAQQKLNNENTSHDLDHITSDFNNVLDPNLFEEKSETSAEENLELGKPLEFNTQEKHSFQEWLKLTSISTINREEEKEGKSTTESTKTLSNIELIDKFISEKPKIIPAKKSVNLKSLTQEKTFNSEELMTETLAKVYLEQKNYKKAIQAYRILSLKYPEKNSFFADRISDIEKIEITNTK